MQSIISRLDALYVSFERGIIRSGTGECIQSGNLQYRASSYHAEESNMQYRNRRVLQAGNASKMRSLLQVLVVDHTGARVLLHHGSTSSI